MKKKFLFSLMFLFFFLFFARGGWLPSDIRLDTGDPPGAGESGLVQLSCSGSNVYALWADARDGDVDVYFNYSTDSGSTWQATDIRLDTGDTPGANHSGYPQLNSNGNYVYAVWQEFRNGREDIYFNYSTDGGATWPHTVSRLDTGDTPGLNKSLLPQICTNGSNVYVVWADDRDSRDVFDIYFNYSTDYGATWLPSDIRLNTGDTPGTNVSWKPQISCCGANVYAVWHDARDENADIYFNYSSDNGATWQTSDIRLDTEVPPGTSNADNPHICSCNNNVYVVWEDERNGSWDIYFNYSTDNGATWQIPDIRLDTGDLPGVYDSGYPQIICSGDKIYVAWQDNRDGNFDIYFNSSKDGGTTWRSSDIRLDTGDSAGANSSENCEITCSGNNVYAVWHDGRNGAWDIYFNCSTDGGSRWQTPDARLDTGDTPGAYLSGLAQVACAENRVYVLWQDQRNGFFDIYFNTAAIPAPDIRANGSDGPVTITRSETLAITVEFDAGTYLGDEADWWLVARTPFGWYHYNLSTGWLPGREVTIQIPLRNLPSRDVLNMSGLPAGTYIFFFGVDMTKNGSITLNKAYYDQVRVTINP